MSRFSLNAIGILQGTPFQAPYLQYCRIFWDRPEPPHNNMPGYPGLGSGYSNICCGPYVCTDFRGLRLGSGRDKDFARLLLKAFPLVLPQT